MNLTYMTPKLAVAGQLEAGHFPTLVTSGFTVIINNRPDGERGGYITAREAASLARANGIDYHHIPVDQRGPTRELVAGFARAVAQSTGPVLAHCRSGHRTTVLWALASAGSIPVDEILGKCAQAGFDLSALRPMLSSPIVT